MTRSWSASKNISLRRARFCLWKLYHILELLKFPNFDNSTATEDEEYILKFFKDIK